jgi:glycerol-3-phosphate dehydrogenase (NAD(P)+)
MRITVIGSGSWGTAMASHLALLGHQVRMWAREKEVVEGINAERRNPFFLSDVELAPGLVAESEFERSLWKTQTVVMAVPSRWTREVASEAAAYIPEDVAVLNLAKGFDYRSNSRLSEAIAEELGRETASGVAVLSGPNHAEEVARKIPSATVIACGDAAVSSGLQASFSSPYFRVYTNNDVIGVEVGGAFKNIIAIAAGVLDGLGLGDNTKASLITRGLAEMARFGSAMGANPITFSGLSGIGDLIVTCISRHSRNRGFGEKLGAGENPSAILSETRMVVEGVFATRAVVEIAGDLGVEIPIASGVADLIEEKASPAEMVERLMTRRLKEESEEYLYRDFLLGKM